MSDQLRGLRFACNQSRRFSFPDPSASVLPFAFCGFSCFSTGRTEIKGEGSGHGLIIIIIIIIIIAVSFPPSGFGDAPDAMRCALQYAANLHGAGRWCSGRQEVGEPGGRFGVGSS